MNHRRLFAAIYAVLKGVCLSKIIYFSSINLRNIVVDWNIWFLIMKDHAASFQWSTIVLLNILS